MSRDTSLFEQITEDVETSFHDFAGKRTSVDPAYLKSIAAGGRWKARLLGTLALLPVNGSRVKRKKYVFLTARHDQLISRFAPDEAAIIGGPNDFSFARKAGKKFCFWGDLFAAAFNILFGVKGIPSRLIVNRWLRFFSLQRDMCYLVVPNDTLPISLLLVKIAARCKNVRVVCVQHGLFNSGYEFDDIDGRSSAINLVYCDSQRREMERRLPGALVEVMGFPAEFSSSLTLSSSEKTAILVGTGTFEDLSNYEKSLEFFEKVQLVLKGSGMIVEYRHHPSEKGLNRAEHLFAINSQSKSVLLAGERKVFLGFASTLLYEAYLAGHLVIILNDAALPGYTISDFGLKIDSTALNRLPDMIARHYADEQSRPESSTDVRTRFEAALARATQRLERSAPPVI